MDRKQHMLYALALLEVDGFPTAMRAQDMALKTAAIEILCSVPMSPGKVVLIFTGVIAEVQNALKIAIELCGSRLLSQLFIPAISVQTLHAIQGKQNLATFNDDVAVLEFSTLASCIEGADTAVKSADVTVARIHLGAGYGGKGIVSLMGAQGQLEVLVERLTEQFGERLLDAAVIPNPDNALQRTSFIRPWSLDPAGR